MEFELRKFVMPEIVHGIGSLSLAGQYAKNYGARKVLVVSDPGVVAAGWTGKVLESLAAAGVEYAVYTQVTPNPRAAEVMVGAELHRSAGCDVIVAVGGGSVIDCAKGIGVVCSNRRSILEFEGVDMIAMPMPPLICIPTTAGTSADVSQFAIISDEERRVKVAIISKSVVPDLSIIDPVVATTMDSYLTACTGIDALVHAIEAYVSNAHSPITDNHALQAIRLIAANLLPSLRKLDSVELRAQMMLGSLEAGLAFSNASLGAVHAMAHSLGGYLDLPHGECNALLLEHTFSFNFSAAVERYRAIGAAMGLETVKMTDRECHRAVMEELRRLRMEAGIVATLGGRGVRIGDIPQLAENAMKDACMVTNPRPAKARDIEVIYEESL